MKQPVLIGRKKAILAAISAAALLVVGIGWGGASPSERRYILIDGGAHKGEVIALFETTKLSSQYPWEIYAIEANPNLIESLRRWENITIIDQAISTEEGSMEFFLGQNTRVSSLYNRGYSFKPEPIRVKSFDFSQWIETNFSLDDFVIVSFDIQGGEYPVLEKMLADSTMQYIDRLYFELHPGIAGRTWAEDANLVQKIIDVGVWVHDPSAQEAIERGTWIDTLLDPTHLPKQIAQINQVIEPGGALVWRSGYGTGTHGVNEQFGIRPDIEVHYPPERPTEKTIRYLALYPGGVPGVRVQERYAVTSLGAGVFRLVPLRIELTSQGEDDLFDRGQPVPLKATASASAEARVIRVEFLIDGRPIAVAMEPPYEVTWHDAEKGGHVAAAKVHDSLGNVALSAPLTIFVGIRGLERSIARSDDDAEELPDGSMSLNISDLDLIYDIGEIKQVVGMRFTDIRIPRGTPIKEAYLQFTAARVSTEQTDLIIQAELAGNGGVLTDASKNLSSRKRTSASVEWSPKPWEVVGENSLRQRTPDLSGLIQEVIDRPDWRAGNALVLMISGSGRRVAVSYELAQARAPRLYVEYGADGG